MVRNIRDLRPIRHDVVSPHGGCHGALHGSVICSLAVNHPSNLVFSLSDDDVNINRPGLAESPASANRLIPRFIRKAPFNERYSRGVLSI